MHAPWIDTSSAKAEIELRTDDPALRELAKHVIGHGFAALPGMIPADQCDQAIAGHAAFVFRSGAGTASHKIALSGETAFQA